jgi:hypothetical protein
VGVVASGHCVCRTEQFKIQWRPRLFCSERGSPCSDGRVPGTDLQARPPLPPPPVTPSFGSAGPPGYLYYLRSNLRMMTIARQAVSASDFFEQSNFPSSACRRMLRPGMIKSTGGR